MPVSTRLLSRLAALGFALPLLGCAPDPAPPDGSGAAAAAGQPAPPPSDSAALTIPGPGEIPPGGLVDWIAEVRRGLASLPARAAADPKAAQRRALDYYVGRQEYIEIYYGTSGRLTAGETLGPAVMSAEARFHELMLLLGGSPPPDSSQVRAAVAALEAEYDRVLQEATRAGVPLDPNAVEASGAAKP